MLFMMFGEFFDDYDEMVDFYWSEIDITIFNPEERPCFHLFDEQLGWFRLVEDWDDCTTLNGSFICGQLTNFIEGRSSMFVGAPC